MKKETRQILDDLRSKGIDVSSVERQLQVNPLLEREADQILGAGLLRQQNYTQYMNSVQQQEREIKEKAQQLATLHDANNMGALPQEALATMKALEDALIETGLFDEKQVRELTAVGRVPLEQLVNAKPPVQTPPPTPQNNERELAMPNNQDIDLSKFIDNETHQKSLGNLALGSILTNVQINAGFDEIKSLGIPVTSDGIKKFQENLKTELLRGNDNLDDIFEKTFEVSKVRAAKAQEAENQRVEERANEIVAERLKKENEPGNNGLGRGNPSPVFARNIPNYVDTSQSGNKPFMDEQGNIDLANVPKNEKGDPKLFLLRGNRSSRIAGATELYQTLREKAGDDPFAME